MWWILLAALCVGAALVTGAIIQFGNADDDQDKDYMTGDDYTDWGDKS